MVDGIPKGARPAECVGVLGPPTTIRSWPNDDGVGTTVASCNSTSRCPDSPSASASAISRLLPNIDA